MTQDCLPFARMAATLALSLTAGAGAGAYAADSSTTGPIEISGISEGVCSVTAGDPVMSTERGRSVTTIPITIGCNSPFTLHGAAAVGEYGAVGPGNGGSRARAIPYDVIWPATLVDGSGTPIAAEFSASGTAWLSGLTSVSGPTQTVQNALITLRLREAVAPGAQIIPDTITINIEQN